MGDWWDGLTGDIQIFYLIGIVAGIFLILQILLLSFGVGFDADLDLDGADGDFGGFISMRGLTAFFFGFGWMGVVVKQAGRSTTIATLAGLGVGLGFLLVTGFIWRAVMKMQSSGSLDYTNAIGASGSVYLPIPPSRSGPGKIEVMLQGRLAVVDAYTTSESTLSSKTRVRVIETVDHNTVLVEPV